LKVILHYFPLFIRGIKDFFFSNDDRFLINPGSVLDRFYSILFWSLHYTININCSFKIPLTAQRWWKTSICMFCHCCKNI